jgi:DNA-3-methyladenine glycosylase I
MKNTVPSEGSCEWPSGDPQMIRYHDEEWGVPVHDDRKHFEFIVLDCFQAGLSWRTVLHKRDNFRKAFDNFDYGKIARYGEPETERLMQDAGIIRNKAKIKATITNARCFLEIRKEFGTFDKYIWKFTQGKTILNKWNSLKQIPATSPESDAMSKDLSGRGFKFVGSTICYSYMQAAGMINDHLIHCNRYAEVSAMEKQK